LYKVVFWRHGQQMIEEYETRADANRGFNFISEYEVGFSDCILDQDNKIIRDGMKGVIGIKKENRIGRDYIFN
jgi:hypothetical protein